MDGDLASIVRDFFASMDREDVGELMQAFSDDAQAVDEISRRWIRGRSDLGNYFAELGSMVTDIRSELLDLQEVQFGDVGVVTCWLEQDYVFDGRPEHISAPTTFVFHEDAGWKIVLIQSVPLEDS